MGLTWLFYESYISSNSQPLLTAKAALRNKSIGELGVSYMGQVYNKFQEDGLQFDKKRRLHVWAVDFNTTLPIQIIGSPLENKINTSYFR